MNIAIVYSLPTSRSATSAFSATDQDTKDSAEKVAVALVSKGVHVTLVPLSETTIEQSLSHITADCIVNLIEWTGADLPLSLRAIRILERRGIPFTGVGSSLFNLTADKVLMKELMTSVGLLTPRWQVFETGAESIRDDFVYPVIMKPSLEHCSIGLTHEAISNTKEEVAARVAKAVSRFGQPMIVEEFITGREFHVAVLQKRRNVSVLPPCEITFDGGPSSFLTYSSRWNAEDPDYKTSHVMLPELTDEELTLITSVSSKAFRKMGFLDYARLDTRLKDGKLYILEANSNPGLDDDPEYEMAVSIQAAGMTLADFVMNIIESCLYRFVSRRPFV